MFDVIIKNGKVIDGAGNPWFKADVGIDGQIISAIGRLSAEEASKIIDADGLVVSPGFIDMHSHSDFELLVNPKAESKIRQGITTEVIGNCGESAAPLNDLMKAETRKTDSLIEEAELQLDWSTMKDYLSRLGRQGVAVNVVPLVGHGNLRACTMGFVDRSPTKTELEEMKKRLAQAMEEGAFGMSTGLIYPPGCYAETDELIELSRVVASYGGIYTSHIRDEGDKMLESVKEAIEIGEEAGIPVEISHHKSEGKANWGKVKESLKMIEEVRDRGIDVTCDVYPYVAASTGLSAELPHWAHEGGTEKLVQRLTDAETRARLIRELREESPDQASMLEVDIWDVTQIARCKNHPDLEGKTVSEIAQTKHMDAFELVFDLLIDDAAISVVCFLMCEDDVCTVLRHPVSMIGTDGWAVAPYGVLGKGMPHPRSYGTFPRVLGKYVREERILMLENAIRKMTSLPAQKLGLRDRGIIREGMRADITIFNPETITDRATYQNPHQYPDGVEYVIVNGKIAVGERGHTGVLAGRVMLPREVPAGR
jgi:N-acyl-D-amino-acid deacylase